MVYCVKVETLVPPTATALFSHKISGMTHRIHANVVQINQRTISPGTITIAGGKIADIEYSGDAPDPQLPFALPGFVDAHVHIESSLLVPSEFARMAVVHGTVATVSDPHEIANVCGMEGIRYMIENGSTVPFHFNFGAPSCVPATTFETAGAVITAADVAALMAQPEIKYLSEVMNFPGVLAGDRDMVAKMAAAKRWNKPIDGHAPGLRGEDARRYIAAGPSTDHECFTEAEAREKLEGGMKVLIREGSAAKNFDALIPLLHEYPDRMMFCSDDKHPDSLLLGHINSLCARAVAQGVPLFHVLQAACINPVQHYGLAVGQLQPGDAADFILVKDLQHFEVAQTYIHGKSVAENGRSFIERSGPVNPINNFNCNKIEPAAVGITAGQFPTRQEDGQLLIPVIEALEGQLITNKLWLPATVHNGQLVSNAKQDILKMVVVNRYRNAPVAVAFIKNFGLKSGALASSVAHDSHNIVAVGVDHASIAAAVNAVVEQRGGLSVAATSGVQILPLPVAGLMSSSDAWQVAAQYTKLDAAAKALGSPLAAPFMTLSFMALLVIPHLKLSDQGLFDGDRFQLL
jgi:adenine deaminase